MLLDLAGKLIGKNQRNRKIKSQILRESIIITFTATIFVGGVCTVQTHKDSVNRAYQALTNTTDTAIKTIENSLEIEKIAITEFGATVYRYASELDESNFSKFVESKARELGFKKLYVTHQNGLTGTGIDFSSYDFYKEAIMGNTVITQPQVTADGTSSEVIVAAPVWEEGIKDTKIVGVVIGVLDGKWLSDLVSSIRVGDTGVLYMLDAEGFTIASSNYNNVLKEENARDDALKDKSLKKAVEIENKALAGEACVERVTINCVDCFLYVTPMGTAYDWCVGAYAQSDEYLHGATMSLIFTILSTLGVCLLASVVLTKFANRITNPIRQVADATAKIADGDYEVRLNYDGKDEIGQMIENLKIMTSRNKTAMEDTIRCLSEMSKGNFAVEPSDVYPGEFAVLKVNLEKIIESLSAVVDTIKFSAENVDSGASQVSAGAQALSQGATEQSSAIEELAATIQEVSSQVKHTASSAEEANERTNQVTKSVNESDVYMRQLEEAMTKIFDTSKNIHKIIKDIDDIAFQTNILALNAAVEAARAGAAGKGFAVVADEVRNLAQKSAESAQSTAQLIEESLVAVEAGKTLTGKTAGALHEVVTKVSLVADSISEISEAAKEESEALSQITVGIDQVSAVVQTNSATAEESAAASFTMSNEAAKLNDVVKEFKTKKNTMIALDRSTRRTSRTTGNSMEENIRYDYNRY